MHKHHLKLLLALLALSGCRTNPACERQIGLMRSELLALEDKYFLLDAKYREAVGQGNSTSDACDDLRQPVIAPAAPGIINPSSPSDSDIRIQLDPGDSSNSAAPQAAPIATNFDTPAQSIVTFQTPARFARNQNAQSTAEFENSEESIRDSFEGNQALRGDGQSRIPTIARDPDALSDLPNNGPPAEPQAPLLVDPLRLQSRDDGLSLVVQIPNDRWSPDGTLSVSVLDPNEVAERQRIGLWRFSKEEIEHWIEQTVDASSVAIPLELSWNQNVPKHSNLMLFVRWENSQFPALDSSQPIAIATGSNRPDSLPVNFEQEMPDTRIADRLPEESAALRNAVLPQVTPQWRPNR